MNWRKWLDDFILAGKGIILATKEKRFWYGFLSAFLFFGLIMNLLSGGTSKFSLMIALGFPQSLQILADNFLAIFGVNQPFFDCLPIFLICILQGILIGLIVLLWNKKRAQNQNAENLGSAGIVAGLIALGAGCPTCGTTLITPLLTSLFSAGGLAVTGTVSTVVTFLAIIVAILSIKRLGVETYVTIVNEKYLARKANPVQTPHKSTKAKEPHEKNL